MTERPPPPAGKVTHPVTTHDPDQRPAIWVTTRTGRWPGREHARGQAGRAVLAAWSENGLGFYQWVHTDTVEPRDS